jgi:hypothetical protein
MSDGREIPLLTDWPLMTLRVSRDDGGDVGAHADRTQHREPCPHGDLGMAAV